MIRKFDTELTRTIEQKLPFFVQENEKKRSDFKVSFRSVFSTFIGLILEFIQKQAKATAGLHALHLTCLSFYNDTVQKSLSSTEPLSVSDLQQNHQNAMSETMSKVCRLYFIQLIGRSSTVEILLFHIIKS